MGLSHTDRATHWTVTFNAKLGSSSSDHGRPMTVEREPVRPDLSAPSIIIAMCNYWKNYYVYSMCNDHGLHFFKTSIDGIRDTACRTAPHERFIIVDGRCPYCR
ncbi:MAG: hypothetical protein Q9210_000434 [Variospora velana]